MGRNSVFPLLRASAMKRPAPGASVIRVYRNVTAVPWDRNKGCVGFTA
jgi:hypothetical protein